MKLTKSELREKWGYTDHPEDEKRHTKVMEDKERDYKDEYKKFQSSPKSKKYRAELNKYNRKKGTYGNGDGKDASHKGGKISGFEKESVNRGRREKSRLKKEQKLREVIRKIIDEDLLKSLELNPDEPHVLNYLAYSWLERNYKIDKAIQMLEKAYQQKINDPYIIDSIGWGYYLVGNFSEAEKILKKLPANKIIICWWSLSDWKDPTSEFCFFWKILSRPLILTYPPRGIGEIFQFVPRLSVNWKIGFPKPIEKSVTFAPNILAAR